MNKKQLYILQFAGIILLSIHSNVFSQVVRASVDRDKIFIGEQVKLKLSVERGLAGIDWFKFPDSLNHLEIIGRSKIDTVLNGRFTNYFQTVTLTSFDSGRWEFPSLSLAGINKTTAPIAIDVLPADISNMQDYNDIKDIEEVNKQNNRLITGIIAAITLLSIGMTWWLLIKKKKAIAATNSILKGKLSPLEWAMAELNKLHLQNMAPAEVKKYYSDLNQISRTFFSMQLHQQSLQQTTDEWMVNLQPLSVDNEIKTSFFQFLRLADTVKFAKYLPPAAENETSVEAIKLMLQKVSLLHSSLYSNYQPK